MHIAGWLAGQLKSSRLAAVVWPCRALHSPTRTAHAPVAAGGGDEGEGDAGVAAGGLHEGGLQASHIDGSHAAHV